MIAPFVRYEAAREELLASYRAQLPRARREEITDLSDLYTLIARADEASSVYTPPALAQELFEQTPCQTGARILDCSGGTGNLARPFLAAGFLVTLMDTDPVALSVAALELKAEVRQEDFLKSSGAWDVIIGNPPYKGHKTMTLEEKAQLRAAFGEVMDNKSDLYYAFFAKAFAALTDGGILSFIVSRYWLESESARLLRRFILARFRILYLHDWYGERPFGAGVDPLLIVLKKEAVETDYTIPVVRQDIGAFSISSGELSEASMKLLTRAERRLRRVIDRHTGLTLGEAGEFHQGIITGFDKAFVTTRQAARRDGIESELLVPWIKSSNLKVRCPEQVLIYATKEAGRYPGFLRYIQQHKERLSTRREVRSGRLAFYELQWGRQRELFEGRRILFAYKAPGSGFVEGGGVFHSADVYSYTADLDPAWLCTILNSPLYDAYIKTELKKLGRDLYEYYPHRLKNIRIPDPKRYPDAQAFLCQLEKELYHDES